MVGVILVIASNFINEKENHLFSVSAQEKVELASVNAASITDPTDISGLILWLDGNDTDTVLSGGAASFARATNEYFSLADGSLGLSGNQDFTIAGWAYVTSYPDTSDMSIFSQWDDGSNDRSVLIQIQDAAGGSDFEFLVSDDGTNVSTLSSTGLSTSTATWYFITAIHDAVNDTITLRINDNDSYEDSTAYSAGIYDASAEWRLGDAVANSSGDTLNGRMDSWGVWTRVLTSAEIAFLYDSGTGKRYVEIGQGGDAGANLTTNLVSWWDMDEQNGNRSDAHASNDLTNNNTVTYINGIAESGNLTDGTVVTTWQDKSGNSNHYSQPTYSELPTYQRSEINSNHVIAFDGTDDVLRRDTMTLNGQTGSVFLVVKPDDFSTAATILSQGDDVVTGQDKMFLRTETSANITYYFQQNTPSTDPVDQVEGNSTLVVDQTYILGYHSDGSTITLTVTGNNETETVTSNENRGFWWGDLQTDANQRSGIGASVYFGLELHEYDGDIAEIVAYDDVILTSQQIQDVEEYLALKYNLQDPVLNPKLEIADFSIPTTLEISENLVATFNEPTPWVERVGYSWAVNGSPHALITLPFNIFDTQYDISQSSNNGTNSGSVTLTTSGCQVNPCLTYDGTDDYTDLSAHIADLEGLNTGTILGWFKSSDTDSNPEYIFSISDKDATSDYMTVVLGDSISAINDESISLIVKRTDSEVLEMSVRNGHSFYKDQAWHHFAVSVGGTSSKIIIDGVSQAVSYNTGTALTREFTNIDNPDTIRLASRNVLGTESFSNIVLDEFSIYSNLLPTDFVSQLYSDQTNVTEDLRGGPTTIVSSALVSGDWTFSAFELASNGEIGSQLSIGTITVIATRSSKFKSLSETVSDPTDISVKVLSSSEVEVSWIDQSSSEQGYKIYNNKDEVIYDSKQEDISSYIILDLNENTAYQGYYLVAYNGVGESNKIAIPIFTTLMNPVKPIFLSQDVKFLFVSVAEEPNNLDQNESGIIWELQNGEEIISSDWEKITKTAFEIPLPIYDNLSVRTKLRNQNAVETEWSDWFNIEDLQQKDLVIKWSLDDVNEFDRFEDIPVIIDIHNTSFTLANNLFVNLVLPDEVKYIPNSLYVDGVLQSDAADGDYGQAGPNGIGVVLSQLRELTGIKISFALEFSSSYKDSFSSDLIEIVVNASADEYDSFSKSIFIKAEEFISKEEVIVEDDVVTEDIPPSEIDSPEIIESVPTPTPIINDDAIEDEEVVLEDDNEITEDFEIVEDTNDEDIQDEIEIEEEEKEVEEEKISVLKKTSLFVKEKINNITEFTENVIDKLISFFKFW